MKTVLVVDDHEVVRLYHSLFLSQRGYRCIEARDGREALAKLRAQRVDLLLLNLFVPNMQGIDLIRSLRMDRHFARLPILAITTEARRALDKLGGGADPLLRFLLKPVVPDALMRCVREMLAEGTAPAPAS